MRRQTDNVIIQTDNEQLANSIFTGNRPGALAAKNHDTGVWRIGHVSKLEILAEWADKAGIAWDGIEGIVVTGVIARLTPHKMIVTEPPPLSFGPVAGGN